MYGAVLPVYRTDEKKKEKEDVIDMDDPKNQNKIAELLSRVK